MQKIVRQKNYFRALLDSQRNNFLSRHAMKSIVRSALEPLLDTPEEGTVLYRLDNLDGFKGLFKRLEFSDAKIISFNDNSGNIAEKVWAGTEFVCVLTRRYGVILVWDDYTRNENLVRFYSIYNSKQQWDALNIIRRNSTIQLGRYINHFNPDRRDNILLNDSIRKLFYSIDELSTDALLGYAEKNAEISIDSDYVQEKARIVAHEIKNQLSICDLYSSIIDRYADSNNVEGIKKAVLSINKAIKMANNSLLDLKTRSNSKIDSVSLKNVIETSVELAQVYLENKNIEFQIKNKISTKVLADREKLVAVIINLVKNATEAFSFEESEENVPENGKYIKIVTGMEDEKASIFVSNNAPGIDDPEKIFNQGFSTKKTGSGLGLWICKKSIEEMGGELELSRSTEDYTEFTIRLNVGG